MSLSHYFKGLEICNFTSLKRRFDYGMSRQITKLELISSC